MALDEPKMMPIIELIEKRGAGPAECAERLEFAVPDEVGVPGVI